MARKIAVHGELPEGLLTILQESGIKVVDEYPLVLVTNGKAKTVQQLVAQDRLPIAIASTGGQIVDLIAAGAIQVFQTPVTAKTLRRGLDPLIRVARLWQIRLDAHARKTRRAVTDLQSTQDLLGRIVDATPNPVMGADPEGRIIVYNRAAQRALGYDAVWVREHMHVSDIYAEPVDARRVLAAIRESNDGFVHELEVRLRARSGEQVPVALSAAEVYDPEGQPMATVGVFQDRRMEYHLRSRLEKTTEKLIQTEQRAAASEGLRGTAHELNQPLTAAMGSLELLGMTGALEPKQQQRVDRAYQQLERMADVIRSMIHRSEAPTDEVDLSYRVLGMPGGREP